jgi:hypothetical protein
VPVTVSVATGSGTLAGTLTVNTDATGRATFSGLSLTGLVGSYTLRFTAPGLGEIISAAITLSAGPPAGLLIVTQPPATATSGDDFTQRPVIQLIDSGGNPVAFKNVTVTAAIESRTNIFATLGGDRTKDTNDAGRATFTDLRISGTGTFTLRFSASGLGFVISTEIVVSP